MEKDIVIAKLKELVDLLELSNNSTLNFFRELISKIEDANETEFREICKSISTMGAIVQYGNYTFEEERLFEELYNLVIKT